MSKYTPGIKIKINKNFSNENHLRMLFGAIRGGIFNSIYGFNGVSGKKNKAMRRDMDNKGYITMYFRSIEHRNNAYNFCSSLISTNNGFVTQIGKIKRQ